MTLSWSMDKVGPICRTAEDCAIVFQAIHGRDSDDGSTVDVPFNYSAELNLSGLRIGYRSSFINTTMLDRLARITARTNLVSIKLPDSPILYVTSGFDDVNLTANNLTGHPCVVVPNGNGTSLTFVGQLYDEGRILAMAKAYQDATNFHTNRLTAFLR